MEKTKVANGSELDYVLVTIVALVLYFAIGLVGALIVGIFAGFNAKKMNENRAISASSLVIAVALSSLLAITSFGWKIRREIGTDADFMYNFIPQLAKVHPSIVAVAAAILGYLLFFAGSMVFERCVRRK
ncbi:Uncharacterised protein [Candidatus Gugararchaeum adminiculabundum]|nr:Uncharacterised protein [Candidatus Gugararchaeum adminiculabundum]